MSRSITSRCLVLFALLVLLVMAPAWAAPVRTGSVTTFEDSVNSGTQSLSIPADAEICFVGLSGYEGTASYFSSGTLTLGGASMTAIAADTDNTKYMGALFYKVLPATGTQTLAYDWAGTNIPADGAAFVWACYKGIDTASPIRSSNGSQQAGNPHTSASLTAQSGDLIVAWVVQYKTTNATITWTGATEQLGINGITHADGSWAEASPTGNQTVSASGDEDTDGGIMAVVLKPAGGGGGGATAKTLTLMGVGQ